MDRPVANRDTPRAIVVMGVSGSGKSTLGRLLADALGCPFLEGDDFHDAGAVAKMSAGQPLEDADRWPWLDRVGRALGEAAATNGCAVAACSALRRSYRQRLRAATGRDVRYILLDNDRDELERRLSDRPGHYMPASLLNSQLETLERPTAEEAVLTLRSSAAPSDLCRMALEWLDAGGG